MTFCIYNTGCCDEPLNKYHEVTLVSENSKTKFYESDKINYYRNMEFPDSLTINVWFKVKNEKYTLRATPEIINEKPISHHYEKGNIICEVS